MVPHTRHQTLVPSFRGCAPAMSMLAPHSHFTTFSMHNAKRKAFMN